MKEQEARIYLTGNDNPIYARGNMPDNTTPEIASSEQKEYKLPDFPGLDPQLADLSGREQLARLGIPPDLFSQEEADGHQKFLQEAQFDRSRSVSEEEFSALVTGGALPHGEGIYKNSVVADLVAGYNQMIDGADKYSLSADKLNEYRKQISEAVNNISYYSGENEQEKESNRAAERDFVNSQVLSQIGGLIEKAYDREARLHSDQSRENARAYADRDWRIGKGIPTEFLDQSGRVKEEDVLARPDIRDRVFDNIFSTLNGVPHLYFQEAWDPLSDGIKYKGFMDYIRSHYEHPDTIPIEACIEKYPELQARIADLNLTNQSLSEQQQRDAINELLRPTRTVLSNELRDDFQRYASERQVRERIHNANALIEIPRVKAEQIYQYIEQNGSKLVDYAHRMEGVKEMMDIYEMVLRQIMFENGGYLPSEEVLAKPRREVIDGKQVQKIDPSRAEILAKQTFKDYAKNGVITFRSDTVDGSMGQLNYADLQDYQVDKIYNYARGMMLMSQRLLSLASESRMPESQGYGKYVSLFMQDAIQEYNPHLHLMLKYIVPNKNAMSALYTEPDREKFLGIRKPWFVSDVLNVMEAVKKGDANGVYNGDYGERLQIRRQSPAHIGDIWTYVGWRAGEDAGIEHGAKLFIENGLKRMKIKTGQDLSEVLRELSDSEREKLGVSLVEIDEMAEIYKLLSERDPEHPSQIDKEAYLNEYANWRGTGLRFEYIRQDMKDALAGDKSKLPSLEKGKDLLERIVELQPGRIFLKSIKVQRRLKSKLEDMASRYSDEFSKASEGRHIGAGEMMSKVQANLMYLERLMYKNRDDLLAKGYTFDGKIEKSLGRETFDLKTVYDLYVNQGEDGNPAELPNPEYWDATWDFVDLMQKDFSKYKDHKGHEYKDPKKKLIKFTSYEEGYYQEFIYNREYNHDYTLWSGDSPVDEFNMGATGATGAFARRAGENKGCGEGHMLMIEMLSDIKKYHTPDEVYEGLSKMYAKVKDYDADKAKEMVFYMTEAMCKMYKKTGFQNMPFLGPYISGIPLLMKTANKAGVGIGTIYEKATKDPSLRKWFEGHLTGSAAQALWHNSQAPAWGALDMKTLIEERLFKKGLLTEDQKDKLVENLGARDREVGMDAVSLLGPIVAIAIMIYILKESATEKN